MCPRYVSSAHMCNINMIPSAAIETFPGFNFVKSYLDTTA